MTSRIIYKEDMPFTLDDNNAAEYMCKQCGHIEQRIGDMQFHIYNQHPKKRKRKTHNSIQVLCSLASGKLRKPDASERRQIRQAIIEAKQKRLL